MKISKIARKVIFPHAFILGTALVVGFAVFGAMMSSGNNGEFGYPEQGIYLWDQILLVIFVWMAITVVLFEGLFVMYKLCIKFVLKNE